MDMKLNSIAALNDEFRETFSGKLGKIYADAVYVLAEEEREEVIYLVKTFCEFSADDELHDKGEIPYYGGRYILWEISGFDPDLNGEPSHSKRELYIGFSPLK